jgi:hypothetical protein
MPLDTGPVACSSCHDNRSGCGRRKLQQLHSRLGHCRDTATKKTGFMLVVAGAQEWRRRLFPYAVIKATYLDGLVAIEWKGKMATRYEHWCGKDTRSVRRLRTRGEASHITRSAIMARHVTCTRCGTGNRVQRTNPETSCG